VAFESTPYPYRDLEFQVWKGFLKELKRADDPDLLTGIFKDLFENPLRGTVLAGGLRKARIGSRQKNEGKSGGYRYLYFLKTRDCIYLIALLDKSDAVNFSGAFLDAVSALIKREST